MAAHPYDVSATKPIGWGYSVYTIVVLIRLSSAHGLSATYLRIVLSMKPRLSMALYSVETVVVNAQLNLVPGYEQAIDEPVSLEVPEGRLV